MNKMSLSAVAEVIRGVSFSKDEGDNFPSVGRLPVIRAGSIQESLLLNEGQIWVPKDKIKARQLIRCNDIIMCTSSGSSDLVGKCAKSELDFEGSFGAFCVGIRPNVEKVSASFLYHFLSSPQFRNWTKSSSGANIKNIRVSELSEFEIPLPPLDEQKRIAAILDKADAIRRKRQQAIQLADDFLRAVFLDMFGDPVTNPKGWEVKPLKQLAKVTTGNTPSRKEAQYYGDYIEWIKSDNINTPSHFLTKAAEYLSLEGRQVARVVGKGSTLVTCIAGSFDCIGNAAYADREVAFNQQINALTPLAGMSSWFLYALILCSKKHIQSASTNSMKGMVSKGKMEEVPMICPLESLQQKFQETFINFLSLKEKLDRSFDASSDVFNSLSQRAFSGRV